MRTFFLALLAMSCYCVAASPSEYLAEMVLIPKGSFRMGSEIGNRDERPMKTVTVDSFQLGRNEVTLAWYLRCMADGACTAPTWWSIGYFEDRPPHLTAQAEMALPITGVNWQQAQAFCRWLGAIVDLSLGTKPQRPIRLIAKTEISRTCGIPPTQCLGAFRHGRPCLGMGAGLL